MAQRGLGINVFDSAVDRLRRLYENGDEVVVSFSAGKDSGICLELAIIAASMTGSLPVKVAMRDEEIMLPGTFEYAERTAARDDIEFHWIVAGQPIVNIFNREAPYFWVFDDRLKPEQWMRQPPDFAEFIPEQNIDAIISKHRFPPAEGKDLFAVLGLRVSESPNRRMGLHSSKGYTTKPNRHGVRAARPIYDWKD
ncbi:unnamed protein product, partial [marine sediment metagenome]